MSEHERWLLEKILEELRAIRAALEHPKKTIREIWENVTT